jgi:hypothetical protein
MESPPDAKFGPVGRYAILQCSNLDHPLSDRLGCKRNSTKVVWTAAGGLGKLPFISIAQAWAGPERPGLGWVAGVNNQLVFLAIDWTFISLILDSEIRDRTPEELEILSSTSRTEKIKSGLRIGASIFGAECILFPQAYAAKIYNRGTVLGMSKGWLSFSLGMVGPTAFTAYSVYASLKLIGRISCRGKPNPTERRLRELKGEMLMKLEQTKSALISMKESTLTTYVAHVQEAASNNDLTQLMQLLLGDTMPDDTDELEILSADDDLKSNRSKYCKGKCSSGSVWSLSIKATSYTVGIAGALGQLALIGMLSYNGGSTIAQSVGADEGTAVATGAVAASLTLLTTLKLAWDGIVGSSVSMGQNTINHFNEDHSLQYRLMPRLTVALNLCDIALMALVWTPMAELAQKQFGGGTAQAVEATAITGLVLLALGGLRATIRPIVESRIRAKGTDEEKKLLELSVRLSNIQRLLYACSPHRVALFLQDNEPRLAPNQVTLYYDQLQVTRDELDAYIETCTASKEDTPLLINADK